MAIRSISNQYLGINAHLHSLWQSQGGWNGFHTAHIGDLNKVLKAQLLPIGYTSDIEPSVQIRRVDDSFSQPESDVSIIDLDPFRAFQPAISRKAGTHEMVLPIPELLAESAVSEKPYQAIAIKHQLGRLIAWIELLSPSNKGNSEDARQYRDKRSDLLHSGIVFIELDYLHEAPPTFPRLANYRAKQPDSHPYRIVIIDPRPDFDSGQGHVKEFDVDMPIPEMTIPLSVDDALDFDFGIPYTKTFNEMLYGAERIDYQQLPLNFQRYSEADQMRIITRLLTVKTAAQQGQNLEQAPLALIPAPPSLEVGLAQLQK